jgi:hypothetical protein
MASFTAQRTLDEIIATGLGITDHELVMAVAHELDRAAGLFCAGWPPTKVSLDDARSALRRLRAGAHAF